MKAKLSVLLVILFVMGLMGCADHSDAGKPDDTTEVQQQETDTVPGEADPAKISEISEPSETSAVSEPSGASDAEVVAKRLVRMVRTGDDGYKYTTTFHYNEAGLLVSTVRTAEYESEISTYVHDYTYDEDNRLTGVWLADLYTPWPEIIYHYDENGYLVEISGYGEGGGAEGSGEYVNDELGRPITHTAKLDFYLSITEYTYSEDGNTVNTVETHTIDGMVESVENTVYTYTYDTEGRMLTEQVEGDHRSSYYVYSYEYMPFVATSMQGKLPYHYSINDVMGHEIWSVYTNEPDSVERDAAGYVTRIVYVDDDPFVNNGKTYRNDSTYEFFYENDPNAG